MPFRYFLSIAGIRLELESDQPIAAGEAFAPFLIPECQPDVRAVFRKTDRLPPQPSREVYRDGVRRICLDEAGRTVRFFYETPEAAEPYGTAVWLESEKTVCLDYLPACGYRFAHMRDCVFHMDMERILIRRDRLWLHASCVETELGGILFSGPSGIGKSTQAELWCACRNACQINGDRPILSSEGGVWRAWGAPYAGSSRVYVNDSCPVSAIVILGQAEQCSLRRLGAREAFRALWPALALHTWDRDFMERASTLVMGLMAAVPVYELSCTPDERAVACLEQELRKEYYL